MKVNDRKIFNPCGKFDLSNGKNIIDYSGQEVLLLEVEIPDVLWKVQTIIDGTIFYAWNSELKNGR